MGNREYGPGDSWPGEQAIVLKGGGHTFRRAMAGAPWSILPIDSQFAHPVGEDRSVLVLMTEISSMANLMNHLTGLAGEEPVGGWELLRLTRGVIQPSAADESTNYP